MTKIINDEDNDILENNDLIEENNDEELFSEEDLDRQADEIDRYNERKKIGKITGLVAGLSGISGVALGATGKTLIDKSFKPKVQEVQDIQETSTSTETSHLKDYTNDISSLYEKKLEKDKETGTTEDNSNSYLAEEYSSDVEINQSEKAIEKSEFQILDFDLANATEVQKDFLNSTAGLITKFHEQTHKDNNFRLENDNEHYLDFTLDEAMSLNLMLNDYSQDEINQIFGSHQFNSEKIQNSVKSAYTKLATYYMNATEKSGLADIIKDENKKEFFNNIEDSVLKFNQNPTVENATDVHRSAYYSYITSGASNDYAKDDLTSFISTSAFMGFVMNNSTTSYQVENFLISRLDNQEELNKYGEAYLRSGTHFVELQKEGNSYVVKEIDAFGNCINRNENEVTIMSLINDKALLKSMVRKSDILGQMIENANEKYLTNQLEKDKKIIEARKFVEYIVNGKDDYRYALFNALGSNFDSYNEFLKECFETENVKEAELKLSSLSMNISVNGLNSHLGKLSENEINEISQTEKGKNIIAVYNKLIANIETKTLTLNEVVSKIDFSKLGGIYGIKDNQAVAYLVNVRRDELTKKYLKSISSYNEDYIKSESNRSSSSSKSTNISNESSKQSEQVVEKRLETTESEQVTTNVETHTEIEEVNKEDLNKQEIKDAERQEKKYDIRNLLHNISARASIDVNDYLNSNEYQSSSSAVAYVNKYNDQDLNNESLINQARLIRAWNDGSLSEISSSDSQIITKRNEAAQEFVDNLTDDEIDLLKSRYGSDWKSEAKSLYKKTWSSDLKSAFSRYVNSISKGQYLKEYKKEEEKINKENEKLEQEQIVLPEQGNNQQQNIENEILPDESQGLGQNEQIYIPEENEIKPNEENQNQNQEIIKPEENNQQQNIENEILPDESQGLGQNEQIYIPEENEIKPIEENKIDIVPSQEQGNEMQINTSEENIILPEEIPAIDESLDANDIEPVSLENSEAKRKVLTRRI